MKKYFLILCALAALLCSCCKKETPRLVIITFDGLRWQELFGGADEGLVGEARFAKDPEALKAAYWRETPQERRQALMPFIWSYAPTHGYLIGNREKNSRMRVSNRMNFSYPGYSEMFCGYPDDERVNSNDAVPNPNHSVLEAVNADPRYNGKVMMYSSWDAIRFAVNNDRGGFPGSSGREDAYVKNHMTDLLQEIDHRFIPAWGQGERDDAITAGFALETIKEAHPTVFYVGFGDTDEYAHSKEYDNYLDAIHYGDSYVRRIVETCEADPFYKGKTTYILTCDHGRGKGAAFSDHGSSTRGSEQTWFIAFGAGVPVLGETSDNGPFYTKQFAATIADILGVEFTPDNGEKCAPIDPAFYEPEKAREASQSFSAVEATPKGEGIRYTYSEGDYLSVEPFLKAPVKASGIAKTLTTNVKLREDHFGLVFKGLLNIPQDGVYELAIATDDGSRFYLDGQLLWDLNYDGGGFSEAVLKLEKGFHRVELQYFENYGGEDISFEITGPGIAEGATPAWYYE